jgi:hypothetical protein
MPIVTATTIGLTVAGLSTAAAVTGGVAAGAIAYGAITLSEVGKAKENKLQKERLAKAESSSKELVEAQQRAQAISQTSAEEQTRKRIANITQTIFTSPLGITTEKDRTKLGV